MSAGASHPPIVHPMFATWLCRARLGRCVQCGRETKPEGPCERGNCSVLGTKMLARLKAKESQG